MDDASRLSASADPGLAHRVELLAFNFTNRCNLRCVYCPQGTHPESFHAETGEAQIAAILDYVRRFKVPRISIGYYGETTLVAGWEKVCAQLLDGGASLCIVANFGQMLTPSELEVLSRFSEIQISIDAVDPVILRTVRKAVDVRSILYNTLALKAEALRRGAPEPRLVWTGVLTDAVVFNARDLVAMAAASGIRFVHYNDLVYFEGARDKVRNIVDMDDADFEQAVQALEEARNLAVRQGVRLTIAADSAIEQRLLDLAGPRALADRLGRLPSLDWLDPGEAVVVYGAGPAGRALIRALAASGRSIRAVVDTYAKGACENYPILSPDDYFATAPQDEPILVCSTAEDEIAYDLERRGARRVLKAHGLFRADFARTPVARGKAAERKGIQGDFALAGDAGNRAGPGQTRLCLAPWTEVFLDPKGEVYACCHRGDAMGVLGVDGDLDAILNGPSYQTLRRSLHTGDALDAACAACAIAPLCTPDVLSDRLEAALWKRPDAV